MILNASFLDKVRKAQDAIFGLEDGAKILSKIWLKAFDNNQV